MKFRLVPSLAALLALLLCSGLAATLSASDLSAANAADRDAASAPFAPPTGLDVTAALTPTGAIGGAGVIEPLDRAVSLASEGSGVVEAVLVTEGATVAAGDVLVRLRGDPLRAALAAAEADEREANAEVLRVANGSRVEDVRASREDAAAAVARAELSERSAARIEALFASGAATADERDRAVQTARADRATADAATARRASGSSSREEAIAIAEARVDAASARRAEAAARVAALELRAPANGEVLRMLVRPGEYVGPTSVVAVVGDTSQLRARLDIDERDVGGVAVGQVALVRIEGVPMPAIGRVVEVGRQVGRKNVRTDDPTDRLDARFVEVVVLLDTAPKVPIGVRVDGSISREATP